MSTPSPDPRPNRCINIFVHYDLPVNAKEPEESFWGTEPLTMFPGIIAETMVKQWKSVDLHFERPFSAHHNQVIHRILAANVDERERAIAMRKRRTG